MKKNLILVVVAVGLLFAACSKTEETPAEAPTTDNPFFAEYDTPFKVPPFDIIKPEHFIPAYEKGMELQKAEIEKIINNPESPTFDNTIVALDRSNKLLSDVSRVFGGLSGANTNDEIKAIQKEMAPRLAAHRDEINLNKKLFERIKAVHEQRNELNLTDEQMYLLENLYKRYVRSGANLNDEDQAKLKEINQKMSTLGVQFGQNVLAETNDFKMVIEDEKDLAGLPESSIAGAAEAAKEAGLEDKWVFTTHKPSMIPFLQYSEKRDLREKLYKAYTKRGDNDNEHDNKKILSDLMKLRVERANLLGYKTYADYILENRMSGNAQNVYALLNRLWDASLPVAKKERQEMQAIIDREGGDFKLASWDWWYYAEKLRKEKYQLDDTELRPYFVLNNVRDGAFWVANQLYGLTFEELEGMPLSHPDAQVFKVKEADGSHCGVLYMDFHPRASKRGGAWCGTYRSQSRKYGQEIDPVVNLVCNFSKPIGDDPAMITLTEVETLFHEFGHGLDNLLSNVTYGTTFRSSDFSELPSQIMEHWSMEPTVLKHYAKHYKTGEPIPDELIDKIVKSGWFNQGFITVEYLAASLLDMKYHTLTEPQDLDINQFEKDYFDEIGLIPEIVSRYRSTYFNHIIGGYAAGYYSYIWSEVLDCDAFEAFKETSLFDQKTANAFRKNILAVNGTADYKSMYINFRGREARIEPLLKKRGLQ
ncbi:MAG: M3 family metallopeptidase [Candidatus Aminicenantes bacterium]|nr:MAG: M3 family metallopeptidase [Candidatus Aminicenantes bacterium]